MNQGSKILGSHFYFVMDGTAYTQPGAGTVDRNNKPAQADTSWNDLGIGQCGVTRGQEEREVWAPTPGRLRRYDIIHTKHKMDWKLDCEELSPTVWVVLMGSGALATGGTTGQYNPLSAPRFRGWLHVQQYDQGDALFNTVDQYGVLTPSGEVKFDDNVIKVAFDFKGLHSVFNTGNIAQ